MFFVYVLIFVSLIDPDCNNLKFISVYHFVEHEKLYRSTLLVFIKSLQKKNYEHHNYYLENPKMIYLPEIISSLKIFFGIDKKNK
jgi:ABC-type uncharacterized transport system substrate-binding protein